MPVNQVSGSGVNEVMLAKNGQNLQNSQFWPIFVIKNPLKIKSKQDRTLNNLGCLISIKRNMIYHFANQSQTCELLKHIFNIEKTEKWCDF